MTEASHTRRRPREFLQVSLGLDDDPGIELLARAISQDTGAPLWLVRPAAVGFVQRLWKHFFREDRRDGCLDPDTTPEMLAAIVRYEGTASVIWEGLFARWLTTLPGGCHRAAGYAKLYGPMYERFDEKKAAAQADRDKARLAKNKAVAKRRAATARKAKERRLKREAEGAKPKSKRGFASQDVTRDVTPKTRDVRVTSRGQSHDHIRQIVNLTLQNASESVDDTWAPRDAQEEDIYRPHVLRTAEKEVASKQKANPTTTTTATTRPTADVPPPGSVVVGEGIAWFEKFTAEKFGGLLASKHIKEWRQLKPTPEECECALPLIGAGVSDRIAYMFGIIRKQRQSAAAEGHPRNDDKVSAAPLSPLPRGLEKLFDAVGLECFGEYPTRALIRALLAAGASVEQVEDAAKRSNSWTEVETHFGVRLPAPKRPQAARRASHLQTMESLLGDLNPNDEDEPAHVVTGSC